MTAIVGRITGRVLEEPRSYRSLEDVPRRPVLTGQQWYILHSVNRSDARVHGCLRNAGYETYYPQQRVMKRVPQRMLSKKQRASRIPLFETILRPLLPSYHFVLMDLTHDRWRDLFDLIGLFGVLCEPDAPEPMPYPLQPIVVAKLRATEVDGAIPGPTDARTLVLEIGEQVRISGGIWAGHNAVVDQIPKGQLQALDESQKVKLLVSLFGRATPCEILVSDIEKL